MNCIVYDSVRCMVQQLIAHAYGDDRQLLERSLFHLPTNLVRTNNGLSYGAYIPGNLPLYSLLTYGLLPSLITDKSVLKIPPTHPGCIDDIINRWNAALDCDIIISREAGAKYATIYNNLDIVFFCGLSSTAKRARFRHNNAKLFIYVGTGVNPFIIDKCANIDHAVKAALYDRTYNGGEDCLSSDIFLVHEAMYENMLARINDHVSDLSIATFKADNSAKSKRILRYIDKCSATVWTGIYKGHVLLLLKSDHYEIPPEFMSPVINIHTFNNIDSLQQLLTSREYLDKAHGITYFGEEVPEQIAKNYNVVAHNIALHHTDHAFVPFGGWGGDSSYIIENGKKMNRPICVYTELLGQLERSTLCERYA
jgi:aldehyde dehydrogenase (NAD+)